MDANTQMIMAVIQIALRNEMQAMGIAEMRTEIRDLHAMTSEFDQMKVQVQAHENMLADQRATTDNHENRILNLERAVAERERVSVPTSRESHSFEDREDEVAVVAQYFGEKSSKPYGSSWGTGDPAVVHGARSSPFSTQKQSEFKPKTKRTSKRRSHALNPEYFKKVTDQYLKEVGKLNEVDLLIGRIKNVETKATLSKEAVEKTINDLLGSKNVGSVGEKYPNSGLFVATLVDTPQLSASNAVMQLQTKNMRTELRKSLGVWANNDKPKAVYLSEKRAREFGWKFRESTQRLLGDACYWETFEGYFLMGKNVICPMPLIPGEASWPEFAEMLTDLLIESPTIVNRSIGLEQQVPQSVKRFLEQNGIIDEF
jgi:hypothetical protein